jgi:hypothetical protein
MNPITCKNGEDTSDDFKVVALGHCDFKGFVLWWLTLIRLIYYGTSVLFIPTLDLYGIRVVNIWWITFHRLTT